MNRLLTAVVAILIIGLLPNSSVLAAAKSKKLAAQDWCADYRASTKGNKCFLVKHPGKCPKGYRLGELFKYSRGYGYRTCIRGSKIHNVGKAVDRTAKKGVGTGKRVIDKGARTGKKVIKKTGGFIEGIGKKIQGWF
jgi:hypothetical protein